MIDYVTIENFFRNIKIKYLECDLKIKDGKIYFEDKNTIREVSIFLSKFFLFLIFVVHSF